MTGTDKNPAKPLRRKVDNLRLPSIGGTEAEMGVGVESEGEEGSAVVVALAMVTGVGMDGSMTGRGVCTIRARRGP